MRRVLGCLAWAVLLAQPGSPPGATESTQVVEPAVLSPADLPDTVPAIWVEKRVEFTYVGRTTYYSCDGIRQKVRYVLQQLGAMPGYSVVIGACYDPNGPVELPRVRIRAALPREATPELIEELQKGAAKRELVARVRGERSVINDPSAQFPAVSRQVRFESSRLARIQDGDCELMEQLVRNVFEPLGVRVVEGSRTDCLPGQLTLNSVQLTLEVLEPASVAANGEGS
ncbi:MAG TPA: hypothetical protein VLM41_00900 [Steroidobacteraceae bacterium]|nr:hypothetical protein [Steroidobacteraceae bacterium]